MDLNVDHAGKSVVFLSAAVAQGGRTSGTGILVQMLDSLYLVTCEHVVTSLGSDAQLTFGNDHDAAQTFNLRMVTGGGDIPWLHHLTADVSVVELKRKPALLQQLKARALRPAHLVQAFEAPPRERPLSVFGFPLGLGVTVSGSDSRISPLSMESHSASGMLTLQRADRASPQTFFILQHPSIGGYSGAPVFMLASAFSSGAGIAFSKPDGHLMGIVHGTISDNTGGKLAAVVPVAYVTELLQEAYNIRGSAGA